ncbi:hydrolase [Alcanivorax hongdengensis A-11-3]|uniref:Hydrolase n=1 Tax=Alcanivorax hongdengensis A-11-3 TaxID=1177179 RepID=L0W7D7_9GAMM|nr:alpha/beta hydrolase [Alcanivorax hongdengensis]EKF72806.1 hydrolase [Alcanivorax hongdengensis A-11-3]
MARTWVLLRGLVREKRHWEDFPQRLQAALPQDRVLLLDLPGNGDLYQQPSPTRVGAMLVSAREQLKARGESAPYHLVALSLGGMMAVQWLSQAPEEVAFAALINTSVSRFSPFWQRLRPANYPRILRDAVFSRDPRRKELAILQITSNLHDEAFLEQLADKWAGYAREKPVSLANSLRQLLAAARYRAPSALPAQVPVMVINGGGDRLVSPRCSSTLANAWQLPLHVHPQAGHDLPLDAPQWLINTLIEGVTDFAV